MFCGDVTMNGLPSLNRITIWAEDKSSYLQSWKTIITLKPRKIYPGHGRPFAYEELKDNLKRAQKIKLHPLKYVK